MDLRLNAYLEAVASAINERLPELASCEIHPGRFTVDELRRFATKAPAVRVALLGLTSGPHASGQRAVEAHIAVYVATTKKPELPRHVGAVNIVEVLADFIPESQFECTGSPAGAENVSAQNLYAGSDTAKGCALWALSWEQELLIGNDAFAATDDTPPVPTALYVGWDPLTGPDHIDHYTRVNGLPPGAPGSPNDGNL